MTRFAALLAISAFICAAQDSSDWQSLTPIRSGDKVRLSLKSGKSVTDTFSGYTATQITVGGVIAKREDVTRVELYRSGGWGKGRKAFVGALIGGSAGAAIGGAAGGCKTGGFGPCISRAEAATAIGAAGAVIGAIVGALLPHHRTEVIYAVQP